LAFVLESSPVLCMCCCRHCAGIVAWASLRRPVGVIALVSPASPLVSQTGVYPVLTPLQPGIFTRIVLAFCLRCTGVLARITLASSPALHCHCCRHSAGVVALIAWASPPCCASVFALVAPRIAASISNWRLPSPATVVTRWRT
jgi:hypothetical protein